MRSAAGALVLALVFAAATPARAQTPYERVSLDTTVGVDVFGGNNVSSQPQVVIDIIGTV